MDTCLPCSGHSPTHNTPTAPRLRPLLLSWPHPQNPVTPAAGTSPVHVTCRAQRMSAKELGQGPELRTQSFSSLHTLHPGPLDSMSSVPWPCEQGCCDPFLLLCDPPGAFDNWSSLPFVHRDSHAALPGGHRSSPVPWGKPSHPSTSRFGPKGVAREH